MNDYGDYTTDDEPSISEVVDNKMRWFVTILAIGYVFAVVWACVYVIVFSSYFSVWILLGMAVAIGLMGYSTAYMIMEAHRCWQAHAVVEAFESKNKS